MKLSELFLKRDPKKSEALVIAKQAGAAYQLAVRKGGVAVAGRTDAGYKRRNKIKGKPQQPRQRKTPRQKKQPFKPGNLGLSAVSTELLHTDGVIRTRAHRRKRAILHGFIGEKFQPVYNGSKPRRDA